MDKNSQIPLAQKKVSLTEEQKNKVWEFVSQNLSGSAIARELNIPQAKIWRNMQLLGLNRKQMRTSITPSKTKNNNKYFDIDEFQNYYNY